MIDYELQTKPHGEGFGPLVNELTRSKTHLTIEVDNDSDALHVVDMLLMIDAELHGMSRNNDATDTTIIYASVDDKDHLKHLKSLL